MTLDMPTTEKPTLASAPALTGYRVEALAHSLPGFGEVYRARRLEPDVPVLITVLSSAGKNERRLRERFTRWTALRAQLDFKHAVLAPLLAAGYSGDRPYAVVARPVGVALPDLLADGPLAPAQVLAILGPIAGLLDALAAHNATAGVVPARAITVGAGDRPVLTELGLIELSLFAHRQGDMPRDALLYAAPELLRGLKPTARSEVYALASLCFEMLTGCPLWDVPDTGGDGHAPVRAVMARRASPPPVVSARHLGLGPRVDTVLSRALAEEAGRRPVSPLDLMSQLRQALEPHSGPSMRRAPESQLLPPVAPTSVRPAWPQQGNGAPSVAAAEAGARGMTETGAGRRRSRSSSGSAVRTGVPVFAAAAVVGSVLAVVAEPRTAIAPNASPSTRDATSDAIGLEYPSTWRLLPRPGEIAGLPLRDVIALEPSDALALEPRVRLLAGMVDSTGARLLPTTADRRVRGTPDQEPVRLGDHMAYRYRDVRWRGQAANMTLYVVPTTQGVATVACLAPEWDRTRTAECEAIATTLRIEDGRALPLGPNRAFGSRLDAVLRRLDSSRRVERARLGRARTAAGQARRALDIAVLYDVAARDLTRGTAPAGTAGTRVSLARRLRAVGAAYRDLASAAMRRDRTAFNRARNAVMAQDAGVSSALKRLRSLGYRKT